MADKHGVDTMKLHQRKAKVAHDLYEQGVLSVDLREPLVLLNEARKTTNYSGDEVDLEGWLIEDLYEVIDQAVTDAEQAT